MDSFIWQVEIKSKALWKPSKRNASEVKILFPIAIHSNHSKERSEYILIRVVEKQQEASNTCECFEFYVYEAFVVDYHKWQNGWI